MAGEDGAGHEDLLRCIEFEGHLSDVTLRFAPGPFHISRTDFVASDEATLFALVEIANDSDRAWT